MATILSQRKLDPKKIEEKLRQFGSDNKCPISGHYSWAIADEFVSVVPWSGKNRNFLFNNTYPAVMLACNGCGYMALFSAMKLGLVDLHEEDADESTVR